MLTPGDLRRHIGKYYGKYSGEVVRINHGDKRGHIFVKVPTVFGPDHEVEARPCMPYGHFMVPTPESKIWVEFEAGDPNYPIWTGVWYLADEVPDVAQLDPPENRVLKTASGHTMAFMDKDGEERIAITHDVAGSSIEMDHEGRIALVHNSGSVIEIDKDGKITITDTGNDTSIVSSKISLGTQGGAAEKLVKGDSLVQKLDAIINAIMTHTHPTGMGPSGPSVDASASLASMVGTLSMAILSQQNTTD